MSDELPSSSWHPALRPESAADLPAPDTTDATLAVNHDSAAPEQKPASPSNFDFGSTPPAEEDDGAAWFADEAGGDEAGGDVAAEVGEDDVDQWLQSDDVVDVPQHIDQTQEPTQSEPVEINTEDLTPSPNDAAETSPIEHADVAEVADGPAAEDTTPAVADDAELVNNTEQEPSEPELPKQKQGTTSQHSSSMSFARTVSHEISFNSDDDDWNLSRTDTDPFKFMPPSDRTNSFPVVPPSASAPQGEPEHSLPASQALDILEETERDVPLADDFSGEHQHGHTIEEQPSDDVALLETNNQLIGGELHNNEAEAAEARFEEGIPLLPADQDEATETAPKDTGNFAAAFGDDDGDDFFSQQQHDVDAAPAEIIQPVERKSTMQVMAAASPEISNLSPVEEQQQASKSLDVFGASNDVADSDFFDNVTEAKPDTQEAQPPTQEDLDAKWKAAFGGDDDDDDFLLDDQAGTTNNFDAAGFLGSDDEGLLEDDDDDLTAPAQVPSSTVTQPAAPVAPTNRYAPASQNYTPAQLPASVSAPSLNYGVTGPTATFNQLGIHGQTLPTPPADQPPHKAASFAAKSTAGYSSPYDLPTDLITSNVRPRKQASMQHLSRNDGSAAQPVAPPRSASMTVPSPTATYSQPPAQSTPPVTAARPKANFFEELPMTSKPRPASRHSNRAPSPAQPPPPSNLATENFAGPPTSTLAGVPPPALTDAPLHGNDVPNLVAPTKVNPYAALPSAAQTPPFAGNANRYSPAPVQQPGQSSSAPPPASANRYSPAPTQTRQTSSQSPPMPAGPPQMHHTHLPRTSSPLAHFEISNDKTAGDSAHADRRASSAYEPRLNRVPSLPPTTEVEEEDDEQAPGTRSVSASHPPHATSLQARYSPMPYEAKPPSVSPSKKTAGYAPSAAAQQSQLPPRSQTQSPGAMRGKPQANFAHDGRPSTSHANPSSNVVKASSQTAYASAGRARGPSLTMGLVPPTDGSEHDPLSRWQGAPIITWGVGGTMVTSFPKSVSRYAMGQTAPTTLRTSGEVKFLNIKDMEPLPERLTKFPGPIKGKSKKKEVLAWLGAGIDTLAKDLPDVSLHQHLSLEAKRSIERLLLWKLLRVFVEHDGHLEGNAAVDQAVGGILSPTSAPASTEPSLLSAQTSFNAAPTSAVTSMQADSIDSGSIAELRNNLLTGDREKAVWAAVDKRLWGHAMLIAHTVSPELYQHVAQEFVRKEVNFTGHNNESLGAFYKIISGNFDDCVDELVPSHARAGFQLMSTQASTGTTADVMDGLDKWQETLSLVLSNRSPDDVRGLKALGQLLSSYGRAEAAQICFIFSRTVSVFGGADAPDVDFVLVGSDHRSQSDQFAKEVEALQLSEIYEYGLSLGGGPLATAGAPHLAAYKLQHAVVLAEYGMRDKALQYCDAISAAINAQTKRSPYYHPVLEMSVDDFMRRLKQAPKEEGSSWMSKPSMGKVSDSMWNRFNKFVAGDENGPNGAGASGESESGPFARIASTPNISRSPSVNNFEMYGGASPNYSTNIAPPSGPAAPSAAGSRYAPVTTPAAAASNPYEHFQQPVSAPPIAQPSNSYAPTSYEPSPAVSHPVNAGYPGAPAEASYGYQPQAYEPNGIQPAAVAETNSYQSVGYQPQGVEDQSGFNPYSAPQQSDSQGFQPTTFEPPAMNTTSFEPQNDESQEQTAGGYEPPSFQPYGYEPPSYQPPPDDNEDDEAPKPKKKSFMDDDDDDIPALRAPSQAPLPPQSAPPQVGAQKTRAEIDRENAELVKKIAEEEEKRAAEQQAEKKGWGFGGWFGGGKKAAAEPGEPAKKAIRAKLGEANSFVYDPELKRWINKAAGAEQTEAPKAAPPPPRAAPRSVSGTPPPMAGTPPPPGARSASNPMEGSLAAPPVLGGAPPMGRSGSSAGASASGPPTGPPSRPTTSMSNASSIDDLLGAPAPRKGGKKPRKSGRYVDVMAK